MPRRWLIAWLATGTACLTTSCRHPNRCCDRNRDELPRDRGGLREPVAPGVIPPRETIPPADIPISPGRGSFDPGSALPPPNLPVPRRETYTPGPIRVDPPAFLPPVAPSVPDSPYSTLPYPDRTMFPAPERTRTEYTPQPNRLPIPDRLVLLDPVISGSNGPAGSGLTPNDLPLGNGPAPMPMPMPMPMPETKPLPPNTSKKELLLPDELPVPNTNRTDPKGNPGLPEFTELTGSGSTQIAVGRKPLIEGLDSLKSRGFRTIAYLHAPNADLSAIRSLVEKRGLTFTPIPAAPETLKAATTQLKQLVADPQRRPVYIFDDDGIRAGSLFYYHFRTVESLNDDQARVRASALGLKEASASPLQKQFWLAIQDLLSQR